MEQSRKKSQEVRRKKDSTWTVGEIFGRREGQDKNYQGCRLLTVRNCHSSSVLLLGFSFLFFCLFSFLGPLEHLGALNRPEETRPDKQ